MNERRSEQRLLCADLVDVRWRDASGRARRAVANLEDISLSGVCVQLDVEIPLGTELRIKYPAGEFTGHVRYCTFREIGYFVGVRLGDDSKWSRNEFRPLHLLDPTALMRKPGARIKTDRPVPPLS